MPLSQFDERVMNVLPQEFTSGFGPATITMNTGGTFGTRIDQILVSWNGARDLILGLRLDDGSGDFMTLGTFTIPAAVAGIYTAIDLIALFTPVGQPYIFLGKGGRFYIVLLDTLAGSEVLGIYGAGGDF